jgi:hypothetical protein
MWFIVHGSLSKEVFAMNHELLTINYQPEYKPRLVR